MMSSLPSWPAIRSHGRTGKKCAPSPQRWTRLVVSTQPACAHFLNLPLGGHHCHQRSTRQHIPERTPRTNQQRIRLSEDITLRNCPSLLELATTCSVPGASHKQRIPRSPHLRVCCRSDSRAAVWTAKIFRRLRHRSARTYEPTSTNSARNDGFFGV